MSSFAAEAQPIDAAATTVRKSTAGLFVDVMMSPAGPFGAHAMATGIRTVPTARQPRGSARRSAAVRRSRRCHRWVQYARHMGQRGISIFRHIDVVLATVTLTQRGCELGTGLTGSDRDRDVPDCRHQQKLASRSCIDLAVDQTLRSEPSKRVSSRGGWLLHVCKPWAARDVASEHTQGCCVVRSAGITFLSGPCDGGSCKCV